MLVRAGLTEPSKVSGSNHINRSPITEPDNGPQFQTSASNRISWQLSRRTVPSGDLGRWDKFDSNFPGCLAIVSLRDEVWFRWSPWIMALWNALGGSGNTPQWEVWHRAGCLDRPMLTDSKAFLNKNGRPDNSPDVDTNRIGGFFIPESWSAA